MYPVLATPKIKKVNPVLAIARAMSPAWSTTPKGTDLRIAKKAMKALDEAGYKVVEK